MKYVYKGTTLIGYTQPKTKYDRKVITLGVNTKQLVRKDRLYILSEYIKH